GGGGRSEKARTRRHGSPSRTEPRALASGEKAGERSPLVLPHRSVALVAPQGLPRETRRTRRTRRRVAPGRGRREELGRTERVRGGTLERCSRLGAARARVASPGRCLAFQRGIGRREGATRVPARLPLSILARRRSPDLPSRDRRIAVRFAAKFVRVALAAACGWLGAAAAPACSRAATTLYITNHVQSNQVVRMTTWQGKIAAATLGGIVFSDPATGNLTRILRTPTGLPSNRVLGVAETPSGSLWAGTQDHGLARLKPDGTFRRTLTSFDGLPSDQVQALYVHGDSIWVGTAGGVALFTENVSNGQVVLRRSDTHASTAGGLVGDNVLDFPQ